MRNRISKRQVVFAHPFTLSEIDREFPAGPYTVETEETAVNSASFVTYRPIGTVLVRRAPGIRGDRPEFWDIEAASLAAALERDGQPAHAPGAEDRAALDRAENEGWSRERQDGAAS